MILSWSGGKDCLMALAQLRAEPRWNVVALLTRVTRRFDRVAMHGIRRDVLETQAAALGLPLITAEFCGHGFNAALLSELPEGVDPCGENGEFHTLSFAGPMFSYPLALQQGESVLRDKRFQFTDFSLPRAAHE